MSAPKPYVTNPTPTHRPCQYSVRIRWLIYLTEKSFSLSYGKHWSRRLQSVSTRTAKGNIHTGISFISSQISEYLQQLMSSRHYIYS